MAVCVDICNMCLNQIEMGFCEVLARKFVLVAYTKLPRAGLFPGGFWIIVLQ